jgi:hypothetical protein
MRKHVLVIGRWHAITRDQEKALRSGLQAAGAERVIFIITAAEQFGTKRHPLSLAERKELLEETARSFGYPFEIYGVPDTADSDGCWVKHIEVSVLSGYGR